MPLYSSSLLATSINNTSHLQTISDVETNWHWCYGSSLHCHTLSTLQTPDIRQLYEAYYRWASIIITGEPLIIQWRQV